MAGDWKSIKLPRDCDCAQGASDTYPWDGTKGLLSGGAAGILFGVFFSRVFGLALALAIAAGIIALTSASTALAVELRCGRCHKRSAPLDDDDRQLLRRGRMIYGGIAVGAAVGAVALAMAWWLSVKRVIAPDEAPEEVPAEEADER